MRNEIRNPRGTSLISSPLPMDFVFQRTSFCCREKGEARRELDSGKEKEKQRKTPYICHPFSIFTAFSYLVFIWCSEAIVEMAATEIIRKRRKKNAEFTVEELDAAETLLSLCHFGDHAFFEWGAKRRRSQIAGGRISKFFTIGGSPLTPLSLSWSDETDDYNGQASPSPTLSLPQSGRVRTTPSSRAPKKKNHNELRESVNALLSERDILKEEEQKLLKTYQDLQDRNEHLKYELALHLDGRQEPQLMPTTWPTSTDLDLGQKTKTSLCFDESLGFDGRNNSMVTADALALDPACNEANNNVKSLYLHSPECSSGSGEEYPKPTKDVVQAAIPDDSSEAFSYAPIGGSSGCRLFIMNKTTLAAEASNQTVELI